ncbi:hypothetical protein [Streptomyces sp. NBC_01262]|uniref:hypothetical protein n=1 Tax=Streptomyces sp. NBC_01262 TaxID=2903803 RepID=UPI002E300857|nr:hypothetical protein [Streptomyces sp. NBC_01262]
MANRHGPTCATRWRQRADEEQWPIHRLVGEIAECCQVSGLRAHRLARGWTLSQAVEQFRRLCAEEQVVGPRLDPDQLRVWETKPERRPQPSTIDLLCRLYRTNARDLGLEAAGDYSEPDGTTAPRRTDTAARQEPNASSASWLDVVRHTVDRTLATASITTAQLDLLDERVLFHRQQYIASPPQQMLTEMAADLQEIQMLAAERQPASVQLRLSEMTAVLATLIADALMKLGLLRQSSAWYATARAAADDSGQRELRARVRAQAAMLPYYYGPLESAIRLAHEARLLAQNRPSPTGAFAAAAEARARARNGDSAGADQAMRVAQDLFDRSDPAPVDDAWAFPERRLLLYLSGTLTYLGQAQRARRTQREAQVLYVGHEGNIDPALLRLDEAICLAHEHHLAEACQLAGYTYLDVPPEHRTNILGARARNVIDAVPEQMRTARSARELGEILALPTSQR